MEAVMRGRSVYRRTAADEYAEVRAAAGVRQGDPSSPAAFALTLDPVLQAVEGGPEPAAELGGCRLRKTAAYFDDVTLIAPSVEAASNMAQRFADAARPINQQLRLPKCYAIVINADGDVKVDGQTIPRRDVDEGLSLMGLLCGAPAAEAKFVQSAATEALSLARLASQLPTQSFLLAVRLGVVPKLMHLCRQMRGGDAELAAFDKQLRDVVLDRLGLDEGDLPVPALFHLPLKWGGLGVMPLSRVRLCALGGLGVSLLSAPGVPGSIQRDLWAMLRATVGDEELVEGTLLGRVWRAMQQLGIEVRLDEHELRRGGVRMPSKGAQHRLWEAFAEEEARGVEAGLTREQLKVVKAAREPSSFALLSTFPTPCHSMTDVEATRAVVRRLCVPSDFGGEAMFGNQCPCCSKPLVEGHEFSCSATHSLAIGRHNDVTHILCRILKAAKCPVALERRLPGVDGEGRDEDGRRVQPDLVVQLPGKRAGGPLKTHFVDVTVGEVLAPAYHDYAVRGEVPLLMEERKRTRYREWMAAPERRAAVFDPVGVSSLGQWGPGAHALFEAVKRQCKASGVKLCLRWWFAQVAVVLAAYASKMRDAWVEAASAAFERRRAVVLAGKFDARARNDEVEIDSEAVPRDGDERWRGGWAA